MPPESAILALAAIFKSHYAPFFTLQLRNYWRITHDQAPMPIPKKKTDDPPPLWTDEEVVEWCARFQIAPYQHMIDVRDNQATCERCDEPAVFTRWTGHDRYLLQCRCGERWLVLN